MVYTLLIKNNYIFAGTNQQSLWRRTYSEIIGIKQISKILSSSYLFSQNYPNPFNSSTIIRFSLPKNSFVNLVIYDMLGKEIETLINEKQSPETYEITFDGSNYPSGVYFYKIQAGEYYKIMKMVLIK